MGDVTPKENEASLGPARPQGTRMGRTYPTRGLGVRQELCVVWFYCNLVSADCFCWQPITANSSPFHLETWGYGTAVQKVGYEYPSYSPKLRVQSTHSCFRGTFCTDFIGAFPGFYRSSSHVVLHCCPLDFWAISYTSKAVKPRM